MSTEYIRTSKNRYQQNEYDYHERELTNAISDESPPSFVIIDININHNLIQFRSVAIAIQALVRLRHLTILKQSLQRGTPLSRFRVCVYASIAITRLSITLPSIRARKTKYKNVASKWHQHKMGHHFRSHVYPLIFIHRLTMVLHKTYIQCSPLALARQTINKALKIKLDNALNAGKCSVLIQLFQSIDSYLGTVEFIFQLDSIHDPFQQKGTFKSLSACNHTLKDLCRWLLMCKQYIDDCTGHLPSRQVFAKLESANTIKSLLLELNKCFQKLIIKFEDFLANICSESVIQDFQMECQPPSLPGLLTGHYLELQAKKDLEHVLSNLEHQPKSFWNKFTNTWKSQLNASEEAALSSLISERIKYNPKEGHEPIDFLKQCLYVDRKHIKVVRFLGFGTYGKVEEVTCFGERYAMKTIQGISTMENATEAVIQARLHHPNIVKLIWYTYDYESENSLSLLMELMDINLQTYIEQQVHRTTGVVLNYPLVSLHIIMQIAKAMKHLHSFGIMHRDLKAANVLIDLTWKPDAFSEGYIHVKVADFGFAKVKQAGHKNINTWKVGTKYWRAPEVFWQDPSRSFNNESSSTNGNIEVAGPSDQTNYSFSADIYSFAMTCYEIVTGKKPFEDCSQSGLKEKIAKFHERPGLPRHLNRDLKALIKKCWDGNPDNRPTFEVICQELEIIKEKLVYG